ncbi:MAG: class I SAM-dependent methyltransferase, partial [bacterium]
MCAQITRRHWDGFYGKDHPNLVEPSMFARLCVSLLPASSSVFEIGCGNGRDSIFMARNGLRVLASDASPIAIERAHEQARDLSLPHAPRFITCAVEHLDDRHAGELDAVYMRFFLHAVEPAVASTGLRWAFRSLRPDGRLFVEARSIRGSMYGKGQPAGRDAFIQDDHYRRFIRLDELHDEIAE